MSMSSTVSMARKHEIITRNTCTRAAPTERDGQMHQWVKQHVHFPTSTTSRHALDLASERCYAGIIAPHDYAAGRQMRNI